VKVFLTTSQALRNVAAAETPGTVLRYYGNVMTTTRWRLYVVCSYS